MRPYFSCCCQRTCFIVIEQERLCLRHSKRELSGATDLTSWLLEPFSSC